MIDKSHITKKKKKKKEAGIDVASKKGVNVLPFWWMACVGFDYIKQN